MPEMFRFCVSGSTVGNITFTTRLHKIVCRLEFWIFFFGVIYSLRKCLTASQSTGIPRLFDSCVMPNISFRVFKTVGNLVTIIMEGICLYLLILIFLSNILSRFSNVSTKLNNLMIVACSAIIHWTSMSVSKKETNCFL